MIYLLYSSHTVLLTLLKVSNLMRLAKHTQFFRELLFCFCFLFHFQRSYLEEGESSSRWPQTSQNMSEHSYL